MFDKNYYIESELKKLFTFREYPKSLCSIISKIIKDEVKDKPVNELLNFFLELYGPKDKTVWEGFSKFQKIKFSKTKEKTYGYIFGDNLLHYVYDSKQDEYTIKLYENKTVKEYLSSTKPKKLSYIAKDKNYQPVKTIKYNTKCNIPIEDIKSILDFVKIKEKKPKNRILRKVFKKIK